MPEPQFPRRLLLLWAAPRGVGVEVLTRKTGPGVRRAIEARLEERGVPVGELCLVEHRSELRSPVPLRCDLKEVSFEATGATGATPTEHAFVGLATSEAKRGGD